MSFLLSVEDRERFAAWCEREAASDDVIITQMELIQSPEVIIRKIRAESMAAKVIAKKLRSITDDRVQRSAT